MRLGILVLFLILKEILSVRFHQESFLIRLWIKLKSAFLNIPVEDVYNSSMIARIAHDIERNFPGLIDYRHGVLLNEFFERTNQLIKLLLFMYKACSDLLKMV